MNEPASLEEEMKDEQERRALHLKRLQNMVDNMNETLGLNDTDKEDVLEYYTTKEGYDTLSYSERGTLLYTPT